MAELAQIELHLEVPAAIEVGAFVSAFTALATEFDVYAQQMGLDIRPGDAKLYVEEVRQGSIIAILQPVLPILQAVVESMEGVMTVDKFVRSYGERLKAFSKPHPPTQPMELKVSELKIFTDQVAAIASTPNSSMTLAAVHIKDGERETTAAFRFDTLDARVIQARVEAARQLIGERAANLRERVLMIFTRTDVGTPAVGQSTGERAVIEEIDPRSRPVIYASDLAEQRIKHEITEAEENVYKKGFVVDVVVETRAGRPIAFKVTNVHNVIDLPDD